MKEKMKLFLVIMISVVISSTISITANTMLQANSISYKTSNGETVDVNSALDRLFDVADINGRLGNTDISSIGDGTITGAVSNLNNNIKETELIVSKINYYPKYNEYQLVSQVDAENTSKTATIEKDGFVRFVLSNKATGAWSTAYVNGVCVASLYSNGGWQQMSQTVFVKKGDVINISSGASGAYSTYVIYEYI